MDVPHKKSGHHVQIACLRLNGGYYQLMDPNLYTLALDNSKTKEKNYVPDGRNEDEIIYSAVVLRIIQEISGMSPPQKKHT